MINDFVKLVVLLIILNMNVSCSLVLRPDTLQTAATVKCYNGLRITQPEIDVLIKKLWPQSYIAMADERYWKPTRREVEKLVQQGFIKRFLGTSELMDCDDQALILHAFVIQKRYRQVEKGKIKKPQRYPWAFGQAWGDQFQGNKTSHAVNICITRDEKVLLIDLKRNRIWEANPESDRVTYVRM